jgi:hypothetical protein
MAGVQKGTGFDTLDELADKERFFRVSNFDLFSEKVILIRLHSTVLYLKLE